MREGEEGLGHDVDKRHGEDDTSAKVLSKLDGKPRTMVVAEHHGQHTSKASNNCEDEKRDNVMPDNVFAMIVVVWIANAVWEGGTEAPAGLDMEADVVKYASFEA